MAWENHPYKQYTCSSLLLRNGNEQEDPKKKKQIEYNSKIIYELHYPDQHCLDEWVCHLQLGGNYVI